MKKWPAPKAKRSGPNRTRKAPVIMNASEGLASTTSKEGRHITAMHILSAMS